MKDQSDITVESQLKSSGSVPVSHMLQYHYSRLCKLSSSVKSSVSYVIVAAVILHLVNFISLFDALSQVF